MFYLFATLSAISAFFSIIAIVSKNSVGHVLLSGVLAISFFGAAAFVHGVSADKCYVVKVAKADLS